MADLGTWLRLVAISALHDGGGRLAGAKGWDRPRWQRRAGVGAQQIRSLVSVGLAAWDGDDLLLADYPVEDQENYRRMVENGRRNARRRWDKAAEDQGAAYAGGIGGRNGRRSPPHTRARIPGGTSQEISGQGQDQDQHNGDVGWAAEQFADAFSRYFGVPCAAAGVLCLVAAAINAGFTEADLQAAAWGCRAALDNTPERLRNVSPTTILRLSPPPGGGKGLGDWLVAANNLWPAHHPGEAAPWLRPTSERLDSSHTGRADGDGDVDGSPEGIDGDDA